MTMRLSYALLSLGMHRQSLTCGACSSWRSASRQQAKVQQNNSVSSVGNSLPLASVLGTAEAPTRACIPVVVAYRPSRHDGKTEDACGRVGGALQPHAQRCSKPLAQAPSTSLSCIKRPVLCRQLPQLSLWACRLTAATPTARTQSAACPPVRRCRP